MRGTKVNIWAYIKILTPYLQYGMSVEKACKVTKTPVRTAVSVAVPVPTQAYVHRPSVTVTSFV